MPAIEHGSKNRPIKWTRSFSAAALLLVAANARADTYYVSPTGSDLADGLTPTTAWATLAKVSNTPFAPGSEILLERGGQWRGQLLASSSGLPGQPIIYGAYGDGAKPRIFGSDVLDRNAFTLTSGTMYESPSPSLVGAVLANGNFLTNAWLKNGKSNNAALNRTYVESHPDSYYYDGVAQKLYLNVGGDVTQDGRLLTATVRDSLVYNNEKSHIVFRDLITDESTIPDAGYGFRAQRGRDVQFIDCEAYRAGKHHFGAIGTTDFIGRGLKAAIAAPDLGVGASSAFVSFADSRDAGQITTWEDIEVRDPNGPYPAWLSHGEGVGHITLKNWRVYGDDFFAGEFTTASDIYVEGGGIDIGNQTTLDRAQLVGPNSSLRFWGGATATNVLIDGFYRTAGYAAPIVIRGDGNKLAFSTITMAPGQVDQVLNYFDGTGSIELVGNVISNLATATQPNLTTLPTISGENYSGDYNVWNNILFRTGWTGPPITFAEWQAKVGADAHSSLGNPQFVSTAAADFHLLGAGSNLVPLSELDAMSSVDFEGMSRSLGTMADAGAFETPSRVADLDDDGDVDGADFLLMQRGVLHPLSMATWQAQFNLPPIAATPEPAAWLLALTAMPRVLRRFPRTRPS